MFNILENGIITVNRGDSFELPIVLSKGSRLDFQEYTLQGGDVLYIGIMEPNQHFENAIIRKKITAGDLTDDQIIVKFWPEDTLYVCPGKYYYQAKLQTRDKDADRFNVETVIDKTLFYIQE